MLTMVLGKLPLIKGLLDFAFPPLCSGCGSFTENRGAVCEACLAAIDWFERPFCLTCTGFIETEKGCPACGGDSFPLYTAGNYTDPLKQIVVRYKFRGATAAAELLAGEITNRFAGWIGRLQPAHLVPIPLHPSREHVRGYNQATLFAVELGKLLDMAVDDNIIFRTAKRRPQAKLSQSQRAKNIRGVFAVAGEAASDYASRRLILVDDVVTSGQTVLEARRTLEAGGFEVAAAIAMAHGL